MITPDPLARGWRCGWFGSSCPGIGNGSCCVAFGTASGLSVLITVTTAGETCLTAVTTGLSPLVGNGAGACAGAAVGCTGCSRFETGLTTGCDAVTGVGCLRVR